MAINTLDFFILIPRRLLKLLIIKGYASQRQSAILFCSCVQYFVMVMPPEENTAYYWQNMGNSLANAGQYEEAVKAYDKSLALAPSDSECWNNRGIVLSMQNRMTEAISSFEKATSLDPKNAEAWHNRGMVLCTLERYEDAVESLNEALEIDPQSACTWHNKGVALRLLGREAEARFAFACAGRIGTA